MVYVANYVSVVAATANYYVVSCTFIFCPLNLQLLSVFMYMHICTVDMYVHMYVLYVIMRTSLLNSVWYGISFTNHTYIRTYVHTYVHLARHSCYNGLTC